MDVSLVPSTVLSANPPIDWGGFVWHGHFTSSWWDGIGRSDHMMHQNQLYRTQCLGNFRTLTHAMALEPAMLVYLNNNVNDKDAPNQNFAVQRELRERIKAALDAAGVKAPPVAPFGGSVGGAR